MSSRLEWIDALKGFTILLVVLGHCLEAFFTSSVPNNFTDVLKLIHDWIYSFHMPLFFFLSGFLYYRSYFNAVNEKIKLKILNCILLYFVFSVLIIFFKTLFSRSVMNQVTYLDCLMLPFKAVSVYWYLYVLIFMYIFTFYFQKYIISFKGIFFSLLVALFAINMPLYGFTIERFLTHYVYFLVGGYCCLLNMEIKRIFKSYCIILLLISLAIVFDINGGMNIFIAFFWISIFVSSFYNSRFYKKTFIYKIGSYTLPIYLLHCYFVSLSRAICKKISYDNSIFALVACFIFSTVMPMLIYEYGIKFNITKLLFNPIKILKR